MRMIDVQKYKWADIIGNMRVGPGIVPLFPILQIRSQPVILEEVVLVQKIRDDLNDSEQTKRLEGDSVADAAEPCLAIIYQII